MQLTTKTLLSLAAIAAVAIPLTGRLARAGEDGKNYPAFQCIEQGAGAPTVNKSEYRISKLIGTPGASTVMLCPIVHDDFEGASGFANSKIARATVHVLDTIPTADVSCTLAARDQDGEAYLYETRSTSGVQSGGTALTFDGDDKWTWLESYYYLKCSLPTNVDPYQLAKIYSYQVVED